MATTTNETLPGPLQESILTTLVVDDKHGAIIAAQVEPEHFDDPYRNIARHVLAYRRQYGRPPGMAHLDDLLAIDLADAKRSASLKRILLGMAGLVDGLNPAYVASRTHHWIRDQRIKQALFVASQRYQQGGEDRTEDIEAILHEALRSTAPVMDVGIRLGTIRSLSFLTVNQDVMPLGIPAFDRLGVGPTTGEMLLYIAPKGTGKTWFSVHCGVQSILLQERAVHITNETSQERVTGRYYQTLFSAARTNENITRFRFELDRMGKLTEMHPTEYAPALVYSEPDAARKLRQQFVEWGPRLGHVVVKEFPTAALTVSKLEAYLDYLEQVEGYIPTVLIIDSPDLFKIPISEFRLGTQVVYQELRGLFMRRKLKGVVTTQGNRESIGARVVRSTNVSEAIGKVQAGDNVLVFSATEGEHKWGIGRLAIAHARNAPDGMTVVLLQSYKTGQYVLDSTPMVREYWGILAHALEKVDDQVGDEVGGGG